MSQNNESARRFFDVLGSVRAQLDKAHIHYQFSNYRDDAVSISAAVPGERWEIDVLEDGEVVFERFVSQGGELGDISHLEDSIRKFSE